MKSRKIRGVAGLMVALSCVAGIAGQGAATETRTSTLSQHKASPAKGSSSPLLIAQARGKGGKLLPPPAPNVPTISPSSGPKPAAQPRAASPTDPTKVIIVGSGGPFSFTAKGNDEFPALFTWKPDKPNDPLSLHVDATSLSGTPRIRWVRVFLGNRLLASEKDFKGDALDLDLAGTVGSGVNQLVIKGGGAPGSTVKWTLTGQITPRLASVDPDEVVLGDPVKIRGQNFETDPKKMKVILGKKEVPITSASPTELKITIPKNFPIDEHVVQVWVNGKQAQGTARIIVRGIPRLTGKSLDGVPPGYRFAIFGENFSKKLSENKIMIGEQNAEVVDGNTEQLFVICPSEGSNFWSAHAPDQIQEPLQIKLKVGKIECKNTLGIFVGNSVWQDGMRGGPDTEVVPLDVRNNF